MFIHLHTHSDGSLQDGCQSVSSIAKKAAKLGMTSVALTDHGRMGNALSFYKACKKENWVMLYRSTKHVRKRM